VDRDLFYRSKITQRFWSFRCCDTVKRPANAKGQKINPLEAKLQKNNVLAELLQEHVELNKTWGPLTHRWVPHDIRDQVVDTVRSWSERTDLHLKDILQWTDIHSSTFNKWTRCNGKAYEHNGKVPRVHWLIDQEKQAIIEYHFDHPLTDAVAEGINWERIATLSPFVKNLFYSSFREPIGTLPIQPLG